MAVNLGPADARQLHEKLGRLLTERPRPAGAGTIPGRHFSEAQLEEITREVSRRIAARCSVIAPALAP